MKKIMIGIAMILLSGSSLMAQDIRNLFGVSWEVAFPGGDFIKKPSFLGGKLEYRYFVKPNLSLGATLSWNNYEEYVGTKTYENADQTQAITTDNERFVFAMPMTADLFYYFKSGGKVIPYAGVGIGAQYASQEVYYNIYYSEEKNWGFVARPQIGALIRLQPTSPSTLMIGAGYNYGTNKNESFKVDNLSNFWVSIGFAFAN
jgi:outer membrane protein W